MLRTAVACVAALTLAACAPTLTRPSRPKASDPSNPDAPESPWRVPTFQVRAQDPDPARRAITYACPMHPEVTSNHAGRCPKCGMALEPDVEIQ